MSESSGGADSTTAATDAASSPCGSTAPISSSIASKVATFGAVISPVKVATRSAVSLSTTCNAGKAVAAGRSSSYAVRHGHAHQG
ncbi:hypothetical protein ABZX62_32445 [Streptomyces flavidovirens]|uniref:hypothetical protein n=1 Tax=Streptomyces flavidovirens TaxID=67298 RepID=UPI0033AAEB26